MVLSIYSDYYVIIPIGIEKFEQHVHVDIFLLDFRCTCGNCVAMSTGRESLCCLEVPNTDPKIKDSQCITQESDFQAVCTNPGVIKTAMIVFQKDNMPIKDVPEQE